MCEYCENLDVTGRGKNLSVRKDEIYRDFIQLVKFQKNALEKKRILRRISTNSRSEYVRRNQVLPDVRAQTNGGVR